MKFYLAEKTIEISEEKIFIPFNYGKNPNDSCCWLVNLSENDIKEIDPWVIDFTDFQGWFPANDFEIQFWDFLKSKHIFVVTGNFFDGSDKGINIFELDEYDLMMIKLLS